MCTDLLEIMAFKIALGYRPADPLKLPTRVFQLQYQVLTSVFSGHGFRDAPFGEVTITAGNGPTFVNGAPLSKGTAFETRLEG